MYENKIHGFNRKNRSSELVHVFHVIHFFQSYYILNFGHECTRHFASSLHITRLKISIFVGLFFAEIFDQRNRNFNKLQLHVRREKNGPQI